MRPKTAHTVPTQSLSPTVQGGKESRSASPPQDASLLPRAALWAHVTQGSLGPHMGQGQEMLDTCQPLCPQMAIST